MSAASASALGALAGRLVSADRADPDLHERLPAVSLLLLLREGPAGRDELGIGLHALGFDLSASAVGVALDDLRAAGLVRWSVDDEHPRPVAVPYALTDDGEQRLRDAALELRRTEEVLGVFLARCGERLVADVQRAG